MKDEIVQRYDKLAGIVKSYAGHMSCPAYVPILISVSKKVVRTLRDSDCVLIGSAITGDAHGNMGAADLKSKSFFYAGEPRPPFTRALEQLESANFTHPTPATCLGRSLIRQSYDDIERDGSPSLEGFREPSCVILTRSNRLAVHLSRAQGQC